MKLLILFLFLGQSIFGQRDHFIVRGTVTDEERPDKRIYAMKVRVVINDSIYRETDCDSLGKYSISVFRTLLPSTKVVVKVRQDNNLLVKIFPASTECPAFSKIPDQYFTSDTRVIEYKENTDFQADFVLKKILIDRRMPCVCFERNSTDLRKCCGDDPDTTINCLSEILIDNPTIVMEISGKTWRERRKKQLSLRRAEFVKRKWVTRGIDEQRIIISVDENKAPYHSLKEIKRAKTRAERRELRARNRTISYKITAFDYDPLQKRRISTESKSSDDED